MDKVKVKKHVEEIDYVEGNADEFSAPALSAEDLALVLDMRKKTDDMFTMAKVMKVTVQEMKKIVRKIDEWEATKPYKDYNLHEFKIHEVDLEIPKNKDSGALIAIGDIHYDGDPNHYDAEKLWGYFEYCKRSHSKIILMGDLIDCNLADSPGAGIWSQKRNPKEQMYDMVNRLYPYRKNIIGIHFSNHELRVWKHTSLNPIEIMSHTLNIPVLGYTAYTKIKAGKQEYWLYSFHGSSGGRTLPGKQNALKSATAFIQGVDAKLMAHVHALDSTSETIQIPSKDGKRIEEKKVYSILTGHYLRWKGSYAEQKSYAPGRIGSPKLIFYKDRHHMHVAI